MMITAVTHRFGAVDQVSLDPDAWDGRAGTLTVDDRVIRLNWFGTRDRHTIGLVLGDSSHLELLMIPPDTATVVAAACLTMVVPGRPP